MNGGFYLTEYRNRESDELTIAWGGGEEKNETIINPTLQIDCRSETKQRPLLRYMSMINYRLRH